MGIWQKWKQKIEQEIQSPENLTRIEQLRPKFNELGYDNWGMNLETIQHTLAALRWLYEQYFRVEVYGISQIPTQRLMLVSNHSGKLPIDAALLAYTLFRYGTPPRLLRTMIDRFMPRVPFLSTFMIRCGQILGEPHNCRTLLENEESVLVFPEGTKGSGKLFWKRYQLQKFGTGFMRISLQTHTPIIPVAVIGAEETYPAFYNSNFIARLLGIPFFPITPFWPWMGILGVLPIPTKIKIYFGSPLIFDGDFDGPEYEIQSKVNIVQNQIQTMINEGLQQRKKILS